MPDLRTLPDALAGRGDIVTPPMDAVVRRARRARTRRMARAGALVVVAALLAPTVANWVVDGDRSSHVRLVDDDTGGGMIEPGPPSPAATEPFTGLGSVASGPVLPVAPAPAAPMPAPVLRPEPPACAGG
nr:hypothetical protein [Actinomycetota bacterium]